MKQKMCFYRTNLTYLPRHWRVCHWKVTLSLPKAKICTFKTQLRTTWVKKLHTKKQLFRTQNMLTGSRSRNLDVRWTKWWHTHTKKHQGSCLSCAWCLMLLCFKHFQCTWRAKKKQCR